MLTSCGAKAVMASIPRPESRTTCNSAGWTWPSVIHAGARAARAQAPRLGASVKVIPVNVKQGEEICRTGPRGRNSSLT
ncbi:hypothetical protein AAHS21_21335 [Mycobacterium sp. 050272]|uniref:hypothetical protein n=1 Tax=Mycobacterium sp. 050272 TaxID=3142488 RepID=UPI0031947B3A